MKQANARARRRRAVLWLDFMMNSPRSDIPWQKNSSDSQHCGKEEERHAQSAVSHISTASSVKSLEFSTHTR